MTHLGLIGLGTMGANLARNAARNGAAVSVFNRTTEKTDAFMQAHGSEGAFTACPSLPALVASLPSPRAIVLMVKAGEAVDQMIEELIPYLAVGDILIDAGNSHERDTARREHALHIKGIRFIGMGVSGGEEGALHGPSMMPGGDRDAYEVLAPLLQKMAADDGSTALTRTSGDGKCVTYIGPGGSGHFVKTVHNGIEYGMMQLIAEAYHLLKILGGMSNAELAQTFGAWSRGEDLRGFLMEITAKVFAQKDPDSDADLLDVIKDAAGQKGTGKWTTEAAFAHGVAIPTITAGVDARIMSSAKEFRVNQSKASPLHTEEIPVDRPELIANVRTALELSMLNCYAQGFQLLDVAGKQEGWSLNIAEIARIWRGGCIIRSGMTELYQRVFSGDAAARDLVQKKFGAEQQIAWRHVVALGALRGIPLPAMSASLSYFDSYRTDRLPQNLIQAQRDFFGAHTFERLDKEGGFHANWGA